MLLLTSVDDKLQVVTGSAANIDVHASWVDYTTTTVTPGRTNTAGVVTATTTDVVVAPAASTYRNVKTLHIRNKHATASTAVTVRHTDGTTIAELFNVELLAGEELSYVEGIGFVHSQNPHVHTKALSADQSNSTTTPTEVAGLTVAVGVGTWKFQYLICYQAAATTTGVRLSVNHTGTLSMFVANLSWVDTSATASTATPDQDAVGAAGKVFGAMAARAKSTAGWGTLLGVDTANADMLAIIDGLMVVTVAGNIALWHGSEVAAQSTVKAGSALFLSKAA
jgi:hypothetical protein